MKKLHKYLTIFSLIIVLITALTLFAFNKTNNSLSMSNESLLAGDTDGITSTELSSLSVTDFEGMFTFASTTYEYSLPVYNNTIKLNVVATAKDKDATVTITGNEYLVAPNGTVTITVSNGISSDSVYKINWDRTLQSVIDSPYYITAAGQTTYTIPATGYYKLEVWGAAGGTTNGYAGGYGGYSVGVVKFNKNRTIYVNVGGQGSTYNPTGSRNTGGSAAGGYNGGGTGYGANCNGDYRYSGGGGGGTHIALSSGVLSSFNSNRGNLLIVAGGGGGGHYIAAAYGAGAHGGGITGGTPSWRNNGHRYYVQPTGGTQTGGGSNGYSYSGYAGSTAGSFGQGGSFSGSPCSEGSAGGGGFYGGGGGQFTPGGGGSGYIANSSLISYDTVTKHMAGYSALNQNTTASTYTIAAKGVSSTATVDYAKTGAGAAKVTLMNPISNDNYLSGLTSSIGIWEKEFDPTITEYKLFTSMYEDEVTLTATTHNSSATVSGDGLIDVKLGYNYINIIVTAPNGDTKTYQVTIVREGLKGKHSSELERIINVNNNEIIKVKKDKYNYNATIYSSQLYLNLDIVPYDEDATYVVEGNDLILEDGIIMITVSAPGCTDSIYMINVTKVSSPTLDKGISASGEYTEWTAPAPGYFTIELWGARGGGSNYAKGGYTRGDLYLKKGDTLYFYLGGIGGGNSTQTNVGGWNGGGYSGSNPYNNSFGGGGASDVRLVKASSTKTVWNEIKSLRSRIMVAGGGGTSWCCESFTKNPSAGGGLKAANATGSYDELIVLGATQLNGGGHQRGTSITYTGCKNGSFGYAPQTNCDGWGGGGGGGYYGGATGNGNAGSGGSSYISGLIGAIAVKSIDSTSPRLSSTGETCTETIANNDVKCSEHYSGYVFKDPVTIAGNASMPNYTGTATMTGNDAAGYARIRSNYMSNNNYLRSIITDVGTWDEEFVNKKNIYNIEVGPYENEITFFVEKYEDKETVEGSGVVSLDLGLNVHNINVTAEDGSIRVYSFNITRSTISPSSELYRVRIDDDYYDIAEGETEIDVDIDSQLFSVDVEGYPFDSNAKVTYSGFGYIKQSKTAYITVECDGANPRKTVYSINLNKGPSLEFTDFTYTGNIQTWTVPRTGFYQLEVWGAQGGSVSSDLIGGFGAYSTGLIYLNEGEKLYITVGGQGYVYYPTGSTNTGGNANGGYNGGGYGYGANCNGSYRYAAGGGGATHISTSSGLISQFSSNVSSLLIVAGGGGGSFNLPTGAWGSGASGGGYLGNAGTWSNGYHNYYYQPIGGSQSSGGHAGYSYSGYISGGGSFGHGGDYGGRVCNEGSGGGAGYYGGGSGQFTPGAGGSGYINNSNLVTKGDYTKHMVCYNCQNTSTSAGTMTKVTKKYSSSPVSDYAKSGNGAAKITYISFSSDNFLKNLKVTDISKINTSSVLINEASTDDTSINENISITVPSTVTKIKIESRVNDSTATTQGNGDYFVNAGENTYTVEVTAEDLSVRTYTIKITRDADTNIYPDDIEINGLVQSLCKTDSSYCKLTNETNDSNSFSTEIHEYSMTVPSRIKQVKFNVIKGHYFQVVTGDGIQDLTKSATGTTDITIDIMSEYCSVNKLTDSSCYSHYTYHITRDTSSDTDVKTMFVDNKNTTGQFTIDPASDSEKTIDFKYENPDVYDYYFSVPNEWTNLKYFYYEKDADLQTIEVLGNGENAFDVEGRTYLVQVIVTAPNGVDTATYRLHVYRELNANIYLSSLSITDTDSNTYPFNMDFVKSAFDYEVTIPYEISTVNLNYTVEVPATTSAAYTIDKGTKSSNVISNIPTGKTTIVITTTSQLGTTGTYTIELTRTYNDDSSLSAIDVATGDNHWGIDSEDFDPEVFEYEVQVAEGTSSVTITPTLGDTLAGTYTLLDNNSIIVGENIKRILVTAEDKSYSTYTIKVIRPASTDATLSALNVIGSDSTRYGVTLEEDVYEYDIDVPNEVTYVNITAEKNFFLASITGTNKYYLQTGVNNIKVYVKAESGYVNTYVINITRAYSSNAYISNISVTGGSNVVSDMTSINQTINVDYHTVKTNLLFTPHVNTTYVTATDDSDNPLTAKRYNNSYTMPITLVTGSNIFKLTTLAEDNETTLTYIVNVVKAPSDDATLKTIKLKETRLVATSNENSYTAKLPYNVDPAHLIIEVNDSNSDYSVEVPSGLTFTKSDNSISGLLNETTENKTYQIIITVTAEDASIEVYTIDLTMQAYGNASNYLTNLTVDKGTLTPTFDQDVMYYEVLEENNVTQVNVSGTLEDSEATVSGFGTYNLVVGVNEVNVVVTATDGLERVYQLVITRKPSSDATLKTLSINGASLSPSFVSSTLNYETSVDGSYIDFNNIIPTSSAATYEVINNEPGTLVETNDTATVTIKVTAEDKVTTKEYKINVTKLPSGNNNLSSLTVSGYSLNPVFNKNTTSYTVNVENDVSSVLVEATSEDKGATITGTGIVSLVTGSNSVTVNVTSESGITKSYLLTIIRAYSTNNDLELIKVNNGVMESTFDSNVLNYNVTVDFSVNALDLSIVLADLSATYEVKNNNLDTNPKVVSIEVTSESGVKKTYSLTVTKDTSANAYLKSLSESSYEFTSEFNSNVFNYSMTVNYETTALDLTAVPYVSDAQVEILNNNLTVGDNTVTVRVTATNNTTTQDYVINVKRNKEVNNFLDYLFNDYLNGDFNEDFIKTRLKYSLTVESDIEEIILYGEKQSRDSTIDIIADNDLTDTTNTSQSYLGTFGLNKGVNKIKINVTNQGCTRTYIITITRRYSSEKDLLSLIVKGNNKRLTYTPDFEVGRTDPYSLTVDKEMNMIELSGTFSPLATVEGLGDVFLEPGLNVVLITITAEDGSTNVVTLNVTKEASDNAYLIDLIPSSGELSPAFGYETITYDLELDSSVLTLSFDATLEDGNASISGTDSQIVPDGISTRVITVTAEDKTTTRRYTINVKKIISDDADLLNIKVKDYDFIDSTDELTKVTFDKDTLTYYVIVNNDKLTFDIDDLTITKSNAKAKVSYSDQINLLTKSYSEFDIIVTAEDGVTKKNYKINVKRELGSSSEIIKVVPTMGYIETAFHSDEYTYVWRVPVGKTVDYEKLGAVLKDTNATVESTIDRTTNTITVVVTSEDGSSVSTYVFDGEYDYNTNVLIESLRVYDFDNDYPYEPELNDEITEYVAHVYDNQETVNVTMTPQSETAKVLYEGEEIEFATLELPDEENTFEFEILGEDGVTKQPYTIIIKKDISSVKTISSLEIIDEDEVCTAKTCILTPTFDPNTAVYKTSVPYEYEIMNIGVGLHEHQSIKFFTYDNDELHEVKNEEYELELGLNTIYLMVYDQLGNQTKIYRLLITRNKSTNTKLDALSIKYNDLTYELKDKNDNTIQFSNDVNEYYLTVPYEVENLTVLYTKNEDSQKVRVNGYADLFEGDVNDIVVKVTAPDGKTIRNIIVHAYRESEFEIFLNDITVSSGIIWDLSPEFDKKKTSYVVNVSNGTEYIKVEGFAESDVVVSSAETRLIETGTNTFEITASKDFDGETHVKTYTVTVIRPVASEVYLSNLKVSSDIDGEYLTFKNEIGDDITFDRGTTDYYLEVSPGVPNLNITATPGRTEWNVNTYGNKFATGRNIVSIIVYNEEYTTSRTYQIIVTVKPSQDSSLTGIKVYDTYEENEEIKEHVYGVTQEAFEASENRTYSITVPYNVEKVLIEGTPTIDKSVVVGEGSYYLTYGNNELTLYVEAEDGEHFTIYTVNVYREYDLYLSNLKVDDTQVTGFVKTTDLYSMEVENDVKSVIIEGIPEENNVEVIYSLDSGTAAGGEIIDGKLYTGVGTNKVLITVRAPDNTEKIYHLDILRKQSDNNYLSALDFNEGNLNETFVKTDNNYTMYILDTYTSISYDNKKDILTEDPTASYVVDGLSNLSTEHDNTVTITVTSQSGISNVYTVTVMLKPEAWFRHYLQKLELSYTVKGSNNEDVKTNAVLSPQFVKEKMAYTATVPYSVASITVDTQTYIPDDEALIKASTEATSLVANGTFSLDLGRNVINVKVYSKLPNNDGSYAIYKVIVYRQNNPDAYLSSLAITGHLLSPGFTSTTLNYDIDIDTSETKLDIEAIPRDPGATVEIIGNGNFHEGDNLIKIVVTAADGTTTKEYKITAHCSLSDNNYLKSLDVKDQTIEPGFTKTNTGVYLVNVDNNVSGVFLTALREDPSASISIQHGTNTYAKETASLVLSPGNNYIYISVSSARGNTRTYTLNVFRSFSTDNTLKDLIISDGDLDPEFDPETLEYNVILEDQLYYLTNVSVIGFKNHKAASVRGNGEYTLQDSGTTIVNIDVTAESGDKRTYKINFIKKEAPSSQLLFLDVYEGELIPEFNKDGYKYYVTVPNEVTSLDLTIDKNVVAVDEDASIIITGNENFKVGINIVTIKVTATNNDVKNYYLYVTRSIMASNYLSDLYVDDYYIEPTFDADTLYYTLTVGSNVDSIHVYGEKEDASSTLEINGSEVNDKVVSLNYGENKIYFTVTSENGASRTYTLVVTRSDSDEYYLLTLTTNLGTWDKTFDKDYNGLYTINVPEKTNMIVFSGTTSVGSTVEGLDSVSVKLGDNEHKIIVTSPSGLKNTYTFKIVRPGSNNADILSITSNHGDLTLDEDTYKLSVEDSASQISFTVNLSDKDAKVIMDSSYNLAYGKNEITIKVEAEDGTEKVVPIEIYRYKDIESVSYDDDEIIMNVGDENTPTYTINPENTDYKDVKFRSDDESIATVDPSTGEITAVSNGITFVYVISTHNERIFDWIKVNVAITKITSQVYDIWHLGDSENNLASVNFSYVIGANDKTTMDVFLDNFDNNREHLFIYKSGELHDDYSSYVGTGMIVKLIINGHEYDELTIIVRGDNGTVDKPGNGIITSTDYATLSSILAGLTVKTPIVSLLYDLNKNKILTVTDLSPMSLYIAGKATFTNLNGLDS